MTLEFLEVRPPTAYSRSWTPFASSEGYEYPDWWKDAGGTTGEPWFVRVLEDGIEVARVKLDDPGGINPAYTDAPTLGPERLEIQFIEVTTAARRRKVATRVVHFLTKQLPRRRLFAYSEGADCFWGSLAGWRRFDHPDGRSRPLFIQPARGDDPNEAATDT